MQTSVKGGYSSGVLTRQRLRSAESLSHRIAAANRARSSAAVHQSPRTVSPASLAAAPL
jgi:hypothetical protein